MDHRTIGNLICGLCRSVFVGTERLNEHYRISHAGCPNFPCGSCVKIFRDKNSLIRHITQRHAELFDPDAPGLNVNQNLPQAPVVAPVQPHIDPLNIDVDDHNEADGQNFNEVNQDVVDVPISIEDELKKLAVKVLLDLRSTSSLTGKAIERFETGCYTMLQQYSTNVCQSLRKALSDRGMPLVEISEVLKDIEVQKDPFEKLRTIDEQLSYFKEQYGLVVPESKFLGTRVDQKLDPKSNSFVPAVVVESFQYISIIETLKLLLSNKRFRDRIFKDRTSQDDVLRSYADGSHCKEHAYLKRHKNVVEILLFYDEVEIANSLGSKTVIHKLAAFFFQILNLPPEDGSKLSSIHLLALAYADDLKKEEAMNIVLTLIVQEMKKLSSEEGVEIEIDGEIFVLRAVLVALTADSVAAHDVLGFLATGSRHFCRRCMVKRSEIRLDANALGAIRTFAMHKDHVDQVKNCTKYRTECGVKRKCVLDEIPHFNCVDNNVFDIFHDLLHGIVPLVIKCVVGHYCKKKLLTPQDFNTKISAFSYGIPDSKNKPSPNFTDKMLKGSANLSQTGTQYWCLIRTLPFLLADFVKEVDDYMKLIFLLQDTLQIIFAFEVTPRDLDRLENLIYDHNELFQKLFINTNVVQEVDENETQQEGDDEEAEDDVEAIGDQDNEEELEQPGAEQATGGQKRKKKPWKVNVINKMHHIKHLPEMMYRFGPAIRMWCAKFEGRMKIFRQHAAICCNFQNPPKTMAKMFQLSNLKSIITEDDGFTVEYHSKQEVVVGTSIHANALIRAGLHVNETVYYTNSATLNGEDYRPGLFVCLPESTLSRQSFGFICDVLVAKKALFLVVKPRINGGRSPQFNAYQVQSQQFCENRVINVSCLANFRCIAPWTVGLHNVYLSLKTI